MSTGQCIKMLPLSDVWTVIIVLCDDDASVSVAMRNGGELGRIDVDFTVVVVPAARFMPAFLQVPLRR